MLKALFSKIEAGCAAAVPVVLLATVAVLATPHRRGIDFQPALRFAVITPLVVAVAVAAAFGFGALRERSPRPRTVLAGALAVLALLLLVALAAAGPPGLAAAALPALLVVTVALAVLVPRSVMRARRSRLRSGGLVLLGALELIGVIGARSSEPAPRRAGDGLAFDVPRALFDVDHRFLDLPSGARIHYVDEGAGPTLLFLHGNPSWSFQWRELIQGLRGSYRCVALDYPGFGWSEGAKGFGFTPREESLVVEEFVDRLGLRDVTLVMQDWGGPIGLGFAERRPQLVKGFVLGSTWAWPTDTSVPRGKFSVIAGGPVGELVQMNFNGFASLGVKNGIVRPSAPGVLDMYVRPFRALDRRGIAGFYPGQITAATDYFTEVERGLPRIAGVPTLIFWALKDQGFPRADLERFEATFTDHRTLELPDADHFFFEDAVDRMLPEMRAFMTTARDAPRTPL